MTNNDVHNIKKVVTNFERATGIVATEDIREDLRFTKRTMNLKDDDAIWQMLYGLLYNKHQIEITQAKAVRDIKDILAQAKESSEQMIASSIEKSKVDLSRAVADNAMVIAKETASANRFKWIAGCLMMTVFCMSFFGYFAYKQGAKAGYINGHHVGYEEAKIASNTKAWSETSQGRKAYQMDKMDTLSHLIKCDQPGWQIKNGYCYPFASNKGLYGWKLPK